MTYDAIVIGGGIVGMSTAYHLVRDGAKTLLIDRRDTGRATDAGAGILSPATNTRDPDPWLRLGAPAFEYYPILIENLRAEQDGETGFATCGMMLVAVSDDEIEPFAFARQQIFNRQCQRGEPTSEDLYEISSKEARGRFPALADVHGVIYYREAARVDGRLLAAALRRAAEARGLTVKHAGVEELSIESDLVQCDHSRTNHLRRSGRHRRRRLVTYIRPSARSSHPNRTPARPDHPPGPARHRYFVLAHRQCLSRPLHGPLAGQPCSRRRHPGDRIRFEALTTADGVREVLAEALRVAPGLANAEIREIRVGLRPYTDDLLPVLGPVPNIRNVYLATGHAPQAYSLAPTAANSSPTSS